MLVKTINVTNPRNVLCQIPSFIVADWSLTDSSKLEMDYDKDNKTICIRPHVQGRGDTATPRYGMA